MKHEAAFNEAMAAVTRPGITKMRAARMLFDAGVAAEREKCATIADDQADKWFDDEAIGACRNIAAAIRKGETP